MAKPVGATYICSKFGPDDGGDPSDTAETFVCHFNVGDIANNDLGSRPDYFGYVHEPSTWDRGLTNAHKLKRLNVEGRYFETYLYRSKDEAPRIFVRWMIDDDARNLNSSGYGFPVGWAVRGYLPDELRRLNSGKPETEWVTNQLHLLPVFRGDQSKDTYVVKGDKFLDEKVDPDKKPNVQRMYWIMNHPSAQKKKPMTLQEQVDAVKDKPEVIEDIATASWKG